MRLLTRSIRLLAPFAAFALTSAAARAQTTTPAATSPSRTALAEAAAKDRAEMMQRLGVHEPTTLPAAEDDPNRPTIATHPPSRRGWYDPAGNMYVRSNWGTWSNYDEANANPYPLPDPLRLKNGQPVSDADTWWKQRRPEILEDFLSDFYGRIPADTPKVTFEVTRTDAHVFNGTAVMKSILGHIDNARYPSAHPQIEITLVTPANAKGPVPVMVVINGGSTNIPGPSTQASASPVQQLLAMGWGYAAFNATSVQADSGGGFAGGIIGLMSGGAPRKPDDWGAMSAWAWGLSRAMDYLQTDPAVDANRCGLEGHSRWGKEAVWAAALDPRWSIVYSSCSGEGGTKLSRRNAGETVDNIAGPSLYHWMAGNFLKYGGHWNDLPVDAHELIALVAPRPIFITGGTHDQWSDPRGEFLAAVGADPVYRLLGKKGLGTTVFPEANASLIDGELAFRDHEGGHTDLPDWPVFLQFAQRYWTQK